MKYELEQVKALAWELAVGEQLSGGICPFCKGGSSGEGSLSVKREYNAASWKCHRAQCASYGTTALNGDGEVEVMRKPKRREMPSDLVLPSLKPLSELQLAYMKDQYDLDKQDIDTLNWLWDNLHNRLWMRIKTPEKQHVGHVLRSMDRNVKTKALTCITNANLPKADFNYRFKDDPTLVIVEDQISAGKAARQFNTCALLGTHMNEELVESILKAKFKRIVLILDKDAYEKALKLKEKYGELFDEFVVKQPEQDLKYLSNKQIRDLCDPPKEKV